jgi:hypothetical protein
VHMLVWVPYPAELYVASRIRVCAMTCFKFTDLVCTADSLADPLAKQINTHTKKGASQHRTYWKIELSTLTVPMHCTMACVHE